MACDYETEYRCGDGEHNLLKKILGRLKELVGLADPPGGGSTVTLTVSDIEIGAVEIKDGDTDARAKVITACPDPADRGLVVRNIPCGTQAISAVSLPLPAGAMTEASFLARTNTLGQKNMSGSMPVVIAADQPPILSTLVGASFIGVCPGEFDQGLIVRNIPCGTQAVSGPFLTDAQLRASSVFIAGGVDIVGPLAAQPAFDSVSVVLASDHSVIAVSATQLPAALVGGRLDTNVGAWLGSTTPTVGPKLAASSLPVVIATDQILPLPTGAATEATLSNMAVNTANLDAPLSQVLTDAQLRATAVPVSTKTALTPASPTAASVGVASAQAVASNGSRKGLILVNTSNARISLGLGAAAVLDSGITLYPGDSFEMGEFSFSTGAVNAIASSAASNLAIQEYS